MRSKRDSYILQTILPKAVRGSTRLVFLSAGLVLTGIGLVGVVTPILPTTPFLILASFCFAKSSSRFHSWLMNHPRLGPPIADWQKNGVIRRPAKIWATIAIALNALFVFFTMSGRSFVMTGVCIIGVLLFIWSRPSDAPSGN